MRRLRDGVGGDALSAEAAALLSARSPLAADAARRRRVRARLDERTRRAPRRRAAWALALLGMAALASAMAARLHARSPAATSGHGAGAMATNVPTQAPLAPPALAPPSVPALPPLDPRAPAAGTSTASRAPAAPARATRLEDDDAEQRLLAAALRALRYQHDPDRASALLDRYLDRYPDGVAREDAFALALEATLHRRPARAAALAARYLARWPTGRWAALARQAQSP